MSIRNLDKLFSPRSIAVIGASDKPKSIGSALMANLLKGGFKGQILPVNPKATTIHGFAAYADIASLPLTPDLAVIATPPDTVPSLLSDLGRRGTRAAVVLTSGFEDDRADRKARVAQLLDAARPYLLRIVGPNCLGIALPGVGINATFVPAAALSGNIALLAQSGAVATSVLDWAEPRGIGFSAVVSLGDMIDVDFGDLLDYFSVDQATAAILIYAEAITHARKFMSAVRRAARVKAGDYWQVPALVGLERVPSSDEMKHFGAALASFGSVALFHMVGVTPEAVNASDVIPGDRTIRSYDVGESDIRALQKRYNNGIESVDLVVFSAPQLSLVEMSELADLLDGRSAKIPLLAVTSPQVKPDADRMGLTARIEGAGGAVLSGMCFYQS